MHHRALVGNTAVVVARVDGHGGQVKIGGELWSARSIDGHHVIEPGAKVTVMDISGATALVVAAGLRPLPSGLSERRDCRWTRSTVLLIVVVLIVVLVVVSVVKAVQIIPQATAAVIERLGRFKGTADPGLVFLVPFIDKVRERIDLREQVVSFPPQPVITQDNLTVNIDTVVYYQVTDPKSAVYEISDYIVGVEQITTTTLRNVVGGMSLEEHADLPRRDQHRAARRAGRGHRPLGHPGRPGWRSRPSTRRASIQESMERQMKADREKRAMILTAEGQRESAIRSAEGQKQSQILTAEGAKQAAILNAEAERQSRILRAQGERAARYLEAQGQAKAIEKVFAAIKAGRPTPELLAYQYLQTLPQMAQGEANKVWLVPVGLRQGAGGLHPDARRARRGRGVPLRAVPGRGAVAASRPEDDDESIKDWFDTAGDPEHRQGGRRRRGAGPQGACRPSARRPSRRRRRSRAHLPPPARPAPDAGRAAAPDGADGERAAAGERRCPTPPRGIPRPSPTAEPPDSADTRALSAG